MAKNIYIGVDNIARKVKKIYIGKNEELQVLDYIESTGTQYIDTECYVDSSFEWEMDFQFTEIGTSQWSGSGETLNASTAINMYDYFRVGANLDNNSSKWQSTITSIPADTEKHTLHFKTGSQKIDGVQVTDYVFNPTNKGTLSFLIGAFHTLWESTVQISNYCKMKVYSSKIYQNGILIRDFIPVKDPTETYCLYDKVSQRKFLNRGAGQFIGGTTTGEIISSTKARKVKKGYIGVKETYKVLDYIESTGTQYIDTEITASQDIKVEMNFENLETSKSTHMFGSRITAGDDSINIAYMNESWGNGWSFAWGDETQQTTDVTNSNRSYILGDNKAYINDTLMHTFTTQTFTNSYNMFLFTCNNGGVPHTQYSSIRLRYCKIWDNNILVRDLIPVKRQNGEYCLYDKVSGKTFYNKGSGSFIAGNETGEIIEVSKARKFYSNLYPKYVKNITRKLSMEYSAFGALKEYILCTGGRDTNGATTASVEGYTKEGVQHVLTSLTQKRERHTCKALGDYVLVIGGATATSASGGRITNTVETYNNNLVKGTASAINKAVFDFGVGANDEHLIQAGGTYYSAESNQAQSYDKNLVKTSITILSENKQSLSGGNVGEFILFLGGTPKNNNIDIYDNKNVRTTISRPSIYANNARDINGASTGKNLFYFCGQVGTTSTYYDKLLAFDENLTQKTATLPAKSSNCNAFNAGEEYVVASIGTSTCIYNNNMVLEEQTTKEKWLGSALNRSCASNEEFAMTGNGWGSETELFNF